MSKFIFTGCLLVLLASFLNYPATNINPETTESYYKETIIFPISEQIKIAREEKRMTTKSLAERVNISKTTLERLEKGQIVPNEVVLTKLEKELGVRLENKGY
jgi:ribosome-binding protein aMBF1 (putative translation factor)